MVQDPPELRGRTAGRLPLASRVNRALGLVAMATLLAIPLAAPTASAQWDDDEDGFFFEGGTYFYVGFSLLAEDAKGTIGQRSTDKGFHVVDGGVKNAEGVNAVFGKRPWEYLAIEAQFEYADGFHFTDTDGDDFELKLYTGSFNAKIFPLHAVLRKFNEGRLQPHLLGGFGIMTTQDLDIDTGASMMFRAGGGLDYFINESWAFNLKSSYVVPIGQLKGLRYITSSIGLSYQLE